MLKTRIINRYLRELAKDYTLKQYIGIAADETRRIRELNYPLVDWGMAEADCLRFCKERGFDWEGLYEIFHRVSCWCCPLQSLDELRKLKNTSLIFGKDCAIWMRTHGEHLKKLLRGETGNTLRL